MEEDTVLGIKRMDHICLVARKLEDRLPMLTQLFGMTEAGRFDNPRAGYNGVTLDIPGSDTQWELLEPSDDESFLARFLNDRGPGLHHVTFQVASVDEATKALKEFGFEPFGGRTYEGYKEVFIHPRDTGGVLIQLYEGDWVD